MFKHTITHNDAHNNSLSILNKLPIGDLNGSDSKWLL